MRLRGDDIDAFVQEGEVERDGEGVAVKREENASLYVEDVDVHDGGVCEESDFAVGGVREDADALCVRESDILVAGVAGENGGEVEVAVGCEVARVGSDTVGPNLETEV